VYDLGADGWPYEMDIEDFESALSLGTILESDLSYDFPVVEHGSVQKRKRDEALRTMELLLNNHSQLFDKKTRNEIIRQSIEKFGKNRVYFIRNLRRFWERGMTPNAFLPDYHKSGAKKNNERKEMVNKTGPKRTKSAGKGVVVGNELREIFSEAIENVYLKTKEASLMDAYDFVLQKYKARYPLLNETEMPSERQFRYYYDKNYTNKDVNKRRNYKKVYDKDIRPLTSTSGYLNIGPGGRYEIDATIADIYLVSNKDPSRIIGRPVIYLVKDVFSRMITGIYVGVENPSWVAAMMALANAMCDKVRYCKGYGVEIGKEDWPSIGVPASIFADRGELLGRQADVLVNGFNVQLSNSRAYRGDDKGIVERHFRTLQASFKPFAKGIVEPVNGKKRLGRRYELDAELSLDAFTKIIILIVLEHNQNHVVSGYDFAPDMPENLPAIPIELWRWGIKNRTGSLRVFSEDVVKVNLMPVLTGSVSNRGILFKGLRYTCLEAIKEGWFERVNHTRPKKVEISFDPRFTDKVYLRPDDSINSYWVCDLADESRRYSGMSFAEAEQIYNEAKRTEAQAQQLSRFKKVDIDQQINAVINEERKKSVSRDNKSINGIRENRNEARNEERGRQELVGRKKMDHQGENVVSFSQETKEDLDYPSLDEFLEDGDD
ncbi:Mu transposase C-terminal domain-containing protein, partial [Hydrogenovibrio marinus]